MLFWSHFKSAIEHFYIKIKRGFRPCFHGLNEGWRPEISLSLSVKYIAWPFQGSTSFVFLFCLVFVMLSRVCLLMLCGHLLGKGWPLGYRLWCLIVCSSLSHMVSRVRSGIWLYRFLIFALFPTFPSWSSFIYGLLICRLSLPCTTTILCSAYVSTEDNNYIVNIKATTCNCIVVTKLTISIFLVRSRVTFDLQPTFLLTIFPRKFHNFVFFSSDFDEIFTERLVLHSLFRYSH